jgi:hypothetical protein
VALKQNETLTMRQNKSPNKQFEPTERHRERVISFFTRVARQAVSRRRSTGTLAGQFDADA